MTTAKRIHRKKIKLPTEVDPRDAIAADASSPYVKMDTAFRVAMVAAGYFASVPNEGVTGGTMISPPRNYAGDTLVIASSAMAQLSEV